jgi:hypothetical protein
MVRRRRTTRGLASGGVAGAALFLAGAAGAVYWFVSRQTQPELDERTRQRLMPLDGRPR